MTLHLCHYFLHVLFHVLWWNVPNVNFKNSSLRCTNDTISHHCIFKQSKLSPDSTGWFQNRSSIRSMLIITKNTEMSHLPVFQSHTCGIPLILNVIRIRFIFTLKSFNLLWWKPNNCSDTHCLFDI